MRVRPHRRTPLDLGRCGAERLVRPVDGGVPEPGAMLEELALTLACVLAVALAGNSLAAVLGF
jgi:hypothetical protein